MSSPEKGSQAWKAQDKGPGIITICWIFTALSTVFVLGRVVVRWKIMRKFHSDDYFVIAGLVCGYISTSLSTLAVYSGIGKHLELLTLEQQEDGMLWTTAAQCPGIMSFGLPKLAVVSLLIRLMNPGVYHKWFLWWMGIWCQLTLFVTVGLLIGRCTPASSLWDFSIEGTCFSPNVLINFSIYAGTFSAFVDVYLAMYPSIVLYRLQMPIKKKVALSCALGIGAISGIVAIYKTTRLPLLASEDYSCKTFIHHSDDQSTTLLTEVSSIDETPDLVVWTVIEGSTIIIASSIPVLHPLLELILKRNPFSSARASRPTAKSSDNNTGSAPSNYRPSRVYGNYEYELGQRKVKPKPKDDLGFTIIEGDSQENIMSTGGRSRAQTATSIGSQTSQPEDGRIVRTDVVTVSYDEKGRAGETSASKRWRPV
ncbi:integral membrane protein [Colletotrichum fioriniae PJ7]|uniref:Integral membrane protein n=1 Tax=Colletotrichum fioriniae PJ7 TaxID=1445577 RepID=A0A010QZY0_9PEZI|nr:integral membrane protein [Colletotrichum fioriniae PJ7]